MIHATLLETRDAVARGDRSASEVCRAALERIEAHNGTLGAFITVTGERALARAALLDRERDRWRTAALLGVPVALKDNLSTRDVRTTAASKILESYVPFYDATVVARLEAAGAVVVGKTNLDEFAMGSSTENSAFGPARNPWATDRIPGGSSGGSAVAVASRMTPMALGSDTGGSIRQPAALCGIVGLKPSYGRVSRFGLLAFASSLDQIGPLTCSVADAALSLSVIAGPDPRDATSAPDVVPDYLKGLTGNIKGVRVGVPRALLGEGGVDGEVLAKFDAALAVLTRLGATLVDVELPHAGIATAVYYLVATAEASSNLARYDGVKYGLRAAGADSDLRSMYLKTRAQGFGAEVKRRIMLGTYVLSTGYYDAYYLKAQRVRTLIRQDYDRAFADVDVVAMPTSPTAAFKIGERTDDPLQMYLADIFTVSANLAGLPAISVPCGFTTNRLPIGLQLTGPMFDEETLLRIADAYEKDSEWSTREPTLNPPPPR
jgi:aspartyl-tRNA(Asn)/glutamyl-tRNA(Gln) amidotransferase subunit A